MEWQEVALFTLTKDWQFTNQVRGRDFKVTYLTSPLLGANSAGMVALVNMPASSAIESTEIFKAQRINSYSISEIIRFPEPPRGWTYRLGIKQLIFAKNTPNCEVKIYMPAYSSAPVFNGSTNSVTSATIAVDNTKSVTLSAAAVGKIGTTITNRSKVAKLYVSVGSAASLTNYDKVLGVLETYESPFNWSGDIFGIWDKADTSSTGNAVVKDFS